MLRRWSESAADTSRRSHSRSRASTTSEATKVPRLSASHSTSMTRSVCSRTRATALVQSVRCTVTPRPRVMKPMISSPGTGVQQRDRRTSICSWPSTWTRAGWLAERRGRRGVVNPVESCSSRSGSSPESMRAMRVATDWAETWRSPTAANRASRST